MGLVNRRSETYG